jgi:methylenetetrahydrofolate reductase (NADPH)
MELSEIYQNERYGVVGDFSPKISFEIFPPKSGDISELFEELRILKKYNPVLVSLTYGASGGLNRFSYEDLKSIRDLELNLMPHFTCVSMLKDEIEKHIVSVENLGIENILALRGDIPDYINPQELDFSHANELVEFIQAKTTLSIGVAGYPEGHIESKNLKEDIKYLKKKVEAGASAIFTQLFFENDKFYRYIETVKNAEINCPIIAGIMPVRSLKQIEKMTSMARITVPKKFVQKLEKFPNDTKQIGTEFAIEQCLNLIENGVTSLHFFTLNHSDQISKILDNII